MLFCRCAQKFEQDTVKINSKYKFTYPFDTRIRKKKEIERFGSSPNLEEKKKERLERIRKRQGREAITNIKSINTRSRQGIKVKQRKERYNMGVWWGSMDG